LWIKVWGIAAVQGSITLTWVIYNLYFPLLLVEFGFSQQSAITILIVENALASIAEPIFGELSDRQQRLFGSKIPLISLGTKYRTKNNFDTCKSIQKRGFMKSNYTFNSPL
jgi:MFS family permease